MSFLLSFCRHFYDNPIQLVGKSAFQNLPELRTLYVFNFFKLSLVAMLEVSLKFPIAIVLKRCFKFQDFKWCLTDNRVS